MKRSVLILFVLLLAMAVTASAQIKFGPKAGVNLADLSGDGWDVMAAMEEEVTFDHKFKMGFAFGGFVQIPIGTSGLMLQPEALYVMKGTKLEIEGSDMTMKVKLDYIEVPILVKYAVPVQGKIAPNFFAGPVVAFNMAAKEVFADVPAEVADEFTDLDIDNIKPIDFGVAFGGGVDVAVGPKGKLTFDIRYTLCLADAFDDMTEAEYEALPDDTDAMIGPDGAGLKLKNSDIRFMVGFAF